MKIGIDLGGSHIGIGLVDENNEILEKRTFYISKNHEDAVQDYIVKCIVKGINEILKSLNKSLENIEIIGIATPGNPKDGCLRNLINLNIDKFDIQTAIKQELCIKRDIKIKLKNDGKCAALAEKEFGSLRDYDDCVFLCIGTGIGGAAFFDGKFIKPKRNEGFEFGHMVIKKGGIKCRCGNNGCFEAYCSKKKFKEQMQNILGIEQYICAKDLIKQINENKNNDKVKKLLDEYIDNLALGISNIINILEPQAISIGGSMSHYEDLIFDKLKNKIYNGNYLFNKENPPIILAAKEGNDAGIIGATLIKD